MTETDAGLNVSHVSSFDEGGSDAQKLNKERAHLAVKAGQDFFWGQDVVGNNIRFQNPQQYLADHPGPIRHYLEATQGAISEAVGSVLESKRYKGIRASLASALRGGKKKPYWVGYERYEAQLSPVKAVGLPVAVGTTVMIPMSETKIPNPFGPDTPEMPAETKLATEGITTSCKKVEQDLLEECPETRRRETLASISYLSGISQRFAYKISGSALAASTPIGTKRESVNTKFCFADEEIVGINKTVPNADCVNLPMSLETAQLADVQGLVRTAYLRMLAGETSSTKVVTEAGTEALFASLEILSSKSARDFIFAQAESGADPTKLKFFSDAFEPVYVFGTAKDWNLLAKRAEALGFTMNFGFAETGHYDMLLGGRRISSAGMIFPKGKKDLMRFEFLAEKTATLEQERNLPTGTWGAFAQKESSSGLKPINSVGAVGIMMQFVPETLEVLRPDEKIRKNVRAALQQIPMASLDLSEEYLDHPHRKFFRDKFEFDTNSRSKIENLAIMVRALYANESDYENRRYARSLFGYINGIKLEEKSTKPCPSCGPVNSNFGSRRDPFGAGRRYHSGIDMSGATGSPVRAVHGGVVSYTGWRGGYGNTVEISHGNKCDRYAHLSRITVNPGQRIRASGDIGQVGSTGRSTGPHLHYEERNSRNCAPGTAVRPQSFESKFTIRYLGDELDFDTLWRSSKQVRPNTNMAQNKTAAGKRTTLR